MLVYVFLYLPIVVVVLFAFNDTNQRRDQLGAASACDWFEIALDDPVVQQRR